VSVADAVPLADIDGIREDLADNLRLLLAVLG